MSGKIIDPSGSRVDALVAICEDAVNEHITPGLVVGVRSPSTDIVVVSGSQGYESSPAVDGGTIFDLASLTKLMVTAAVSMILFEEKRLEIGTEVNGLLPELKSPWPVTVGDLLSHSAGFDPSLPSVPEEVDPALVARLLLEQKPSSRPGSTTVYSDVGMMILGVFLERLTGNPLEELVSDRVFSPLGMKETLFSPPADLVGRIAPTEILKDGVLVHGVVHDETARAMGGVAPHAGLFSTVSDVLIFGKSLLPQTADWERFVSRETVAEFTRLPDRDPQRDWVFGMRRVGRDPLFSGLPSRMLGVTGFTGTFLGLDMERGAAVTILSNAVYPDRRNGPMISIRGSIAGAALSAVGANWPS